MASNTCRICDGKLEEPWRNGVCYGCHLDTFIPADYTRKERYAYDPAFAQINATAHPLTGVEILDSTPTRVSQAMVPKT